MQQQEDLQTFMETNNNLKSGDKVWLVRVTKKLPKLYESVVTGTGSIICNEKSEYQFRSDNVSYTTPIHKKELSFMKSFGYIKYPIKRNFEFSVIGIKFFKHHVAYTSELTHKEIYLFNKEEYPQTIDKPWQLRTIETMLDEKRFLYCWGGAKVHEQNIENFKTCDINLSDFHKTEIYVCSNTSVVFLKEEDAKLYCKQLLNNAFSRKKKEVQHYYKKITSAIAEKSKLKHALSLFK